MKRPLLRGDWRREDSDFVNNQEIPNFLAPRYSEKYWILCRRPSRLPTVEPESPVPTLLELQVLRGSSVRANLQDACGPTRKWRVDQVFFQALLSSRPSGRRLILRHQFCVPFLQANEVHPV